MERTQLKLVFAFKSGGIEVVPIYSDQTFVGIINTLAVDQSMLNLELSQKITDFGQTVHLLIL